MSIAETVGNVFTDQVNASWYADEDDNVELELRVADLLEMNWVPGHRPSEPGESLGLKPCWATRASILLPVGTPTFERDSAPGVPLLLGHPNTWKEISAGIWDTRRGCGYTVRLTLEGVEVARRSYEFSLWLSNECLAEDVIAALLQKTATLGDRAIKWENVYSPGYERYSETTSLSNLLTGRTKWGTYTSSTIDGMIRTQHIGYSK